MKTGASTVGGTRESAIPSPTGDAAEAHPGVPLHGTPLRGLAAATLGFAVGFAAVSLFGPTAKLLKEAMGLSAAQLGLLVAVPSLTGSLLRIPFGAWVDTTGGRKPFLVLLAVSAVGMAGLLAALYFLYPDRLGRSWYPAVLLLGALAGSGIATFSVGIGQVSYWYPQKAQGRALGAYAGIGNMAPGIFALLLPLVTGWIGLTGAYGLWLLLLLAGIGLYAVIAVDAWFFQLWREGRGLPREEARRLAKLRGQELIPTGGVWEGLGATARLAETWLLVLLYFTSFGGFLALTAWLPTFWQELFDLSSKAAGALTMTYSVLTSLVRVPGGALSDRFGGRRTAAWSFLLVTVGASVIWLAPSYPAVVTGTILMALGMGVANAAVFKMVPYYLASAGGGAGAGWVGGLGAFGGFALPPMMAGLVDRLGEERGYPAGFGLFVALGLISLVVVARLQPRAAARSARERR